MVCFNLNSEFYILIFEISVNWKYFYLTTFKYFGLRIEKNALFLEKTLDTARKLLIRSN